MKTRTFIGMAVMLMAFMSITKAHGQEQGEYAYKKMTSQQGDTLLSESPVETTSKLSRMETIYKLSTDIRLCEGDLITGVTFKGYNPGKEKTRHLSVWMRNDYELRMPGDFTSVDEMTKVYEGDCKILHGGTANIPEDILNIKFDTPVAYVNPNHLRLTIMSEGEASSDSVLFLHFKGRFVSSLCATSGDDEDLGEPFYSKQPFAIFTIATPVRYVSGTVSDEDGKGIDGATIKLKSRQWDETNYEGVTDAEGKYQIRIEEGNKTYAPTVTAPGHTSYYDIGEGSPVLDNPIWDFNIYGSVTYPANQQSSIILPVAPDPTAGKYYKLVRREGRKFIFEREQKPQANVPYVLFADYDYRVDLDDMDLSITPGRIDIDSLSLIGSYCTTVNTSYALYIDKSIDTNITPCTAMHAYLSAYYTLLYDDYSLVFDDSVTNAVQSIADVATPNVIYDLQGRRLSAKPQKGLYIQNGRKIVVK